MFALSQCIYSSPAWRFCITWTGSLSNNDSDGYENVTWKVKPCCFKLYRAYSISFNSSNVGNFFLELNSRRLYQSSGKEKESCRLVFTSSTKREIMHFHVLDVQWRKRNVGKSVMHVQGCCFVNLNLGLLLFCRFRWRHHRRRCLSSVITSYRRLISRSRIWFKMTSHFLNVLLQKLISSHYYIISNGHSLYLWQPNPPYSVSVLLFAPSGVIKAMVAHSLKSCRIHVKVLCMLSKDSKY